MRHAGRFGIARLQYLASSAALLTKPLPCRLRVRSIWVWACCMPTWASRSSIVASTVPLAAALDCTVTVSTPTTCAQTGASSKKTEPGGVLEQAGAQ